MIILILPLLIIFLPSAILFLIIKLWKKNRKISTWEKISLANPPEPQEYRYTFIEYIGKDEKLIEVRSYDKDY